MPPALSDDEASIEVEEVPQTLGDDEILQVESEEEKKMEEGEGEAEAKADVEAKAAAKAEGEAAGEEWPGEGEGEGQGEGPREGEGEGPGEEEGEDENEDEDEGDGEEDDEDEGLEEDEYIVEAILNHFIDEETKEPKFEVKWEGYEKKSDRTWEPERNLTGTASKILDAYYAKIGGKEALFSSLKEKKAAVKNPKKRGRASTSTSTPQTTNGAKRGRKNNPHPSSTTPPASANYSGFKPPTGSWEEEVTGIDACEGTEGKVVVYLTWASGAKSQHPLSQVYKRCPQKMLKFYESHLIFKKTET